VEGLGDALVAAKAVNANSNATQAQVDTAQFDLVAKVAAARLRAQTQALSQAITFAAQLDTSGFTTASVNVLRLALVQARQVLDDANATQAQANSAVDAVAAALRGLAVAGVAQAPGQENPGTQTPGTPGGSGTGVTAGPEAGGQAGAPSADTSAQVTAPQVPATSSAVVRVKAAQRAVTLVKGQSIRLSAGAYTAAGAKAKVSWKSSKAKVAKVATNGTITAKKAGKAMITVKAGGKATRIAVTVLAKKPASAKVATVKATGVPKTLAVGATAAITGSYTPARTLKAKVTYASSNPSVLVVDKNGIVTAKAAGKAKITVKAGTKAKKYTVTVK
jgi:hypothetical protein